VADEGLGGLARRWLKARTEELVTTDRHARENADAVADQAERQARDEMVEQAVYTALPGLKRMKEQSEQAARDREATRFQERQAELAARPLATVRMAIGGAATDRWQGQLPALVEVLPPAPVGQDDEDGYADPDPYAAEPALHVELAPPAGAEPMIAGAPLRELAFFVPGYAGDGTYDLVASAMARREANAEPDYLDWHLEFVDDDEGFYFYPDAGPSSVSVTDGGRRIDVAIRLSGARGDLAVRAEIVLPG
jgi:hypothetical protein